MSDERPRNEAAMADILASIRKIVADEDRRSVHASTAPDGDVLVLTPQMRLPAEADEAPAAPAVPSFLVSYGPKPPPLAFRRPEPPRREAERQPAREAPARHTVDAPEGALTPDEATVADIARAVLREEFDGPFGRALTARIEAMVRAEVARAMGGQGDAKG